MRTVFVEIEGQTDRDLRNYSMMSSIAGHNNLVALSIADRTAIALPRSVIYSLNNLNISSLELYATDVA